MSSNIYVYTYQHTCKKAHNAFVLLRAPFRANIRTARSGKTSIPFLGEGYYLWEENIDIAKRWGVNHYENDYSIVEYRNMQLKAAEFLDLTDRRQIKYFNELQEIFTSKRPEAAEWKIGQWIEFFKVTRKKNHDLFPFNYIKADEHLPNVEENNAVRKKSLFVDGAWYYTYLSPIYILCVINKEQMIYESKSIIAI